MILSGDKYKKFMEQMNLGIDILIGSDFSELSEHMMENNEQLMSVGKAVAPTVDNIREFLTEEIKKVLIEENKNISAGRYFSKFFFEVKCTNKEKFVRLTWRNYKGIQFDTKFEIEI